MTDYETIIKELKVIADSDECNGCCYPYMANGVICVSKTAEDVLNLLIEQRKIIDDLKRSINH